MSTKPIASNDILTVPNVISGLRLVVSAAVFVLLAWQWWGWGLAAFVLAASTDAVDGWYARRYNAVSVLGRILDPLVDKVLICGTYVMLAATPAAAGQPVSIVGWMAVVVVVRELVVTGVRGEMERQGIDFSAGFSGKLKMILQSIAIPADLIVRGDLAAGLGEPARGMLPTVALVTAWLAILLTIWSGVEYLWAARGVLTGSHRR
ncbi:MAG: CDP-alcohol phosphatidyltransferase family protein [Pirellulales bacterium]|jgi:CDP-diacylglycerol--glycerol-3-phosphate 3-phosphatidyltransferase|nr:CDP-alcohol phosphatidyltransferase family protein [Pirellulales bacterium]